MKRLPVLVLLSVMGCSGSGKRSKDDAVPATPTPTPTASPATSPPPSVAPSASPSASTPPAGPAGDECATLFSPPPGAHKLCDEHVMGKGAEIHWQSYAFTEPRFAVFKPYWDAASRCKVSLVTKPPLLSISRDGWRLEAFDVEGGGFPTCDKAPGPEHKSVIMISVKYDR